MTLSVKHAFNSLKSDGVDVSFVQPSYWNAEHVITAGAYTVLGRNAGTAGTVTDVAIDDFGVPLGVPLAFTGPSGSVPGKYLLAFGQAISRATYADYFTLVSTTYGVGDGSTTFNMPDLRGRTIFGIGNMGGVESSRLNSIIASTLGATGGAQTEAAGVTGTCVVGGSTSGSLSVNVTSTSMDGPSLSTNAQAGASWFDIAAANHTHANVQSSGGTSGSLVVNATGSISGATAAVTNVPPGMALNVMVKVLR